MTTQDRAPGAPEPGFNAYGVRTEFTLDTPHGTFTTTLYPAGLALDLIPWLLALAAGPSGVVVEVLRSAMTAGDLMHGDVAGAEVRAGLLTLSEQAARFGGSEQIRKVLSTTTFKSAHTGATAHAGHELDAVFQGRLNVLAEVVAWVLRKQLGPFGSGEGEQSPLRLIQWLKKFSDAQASPPSA